jgi:hypothetical protein
MKRVMRAAAVAALAAGSTGSIGCVTTGKGPSECAAGGGAIYRQFVDPCYPERYNATARAEVLAPFAIQVNNGQFLNQTMWNWYFETGTDKLTTAGRAKLDSIAQTRPAPDTRLYLQAARDVVVTNENMEKVGGVRDELTVRRAAAVQRYMSTQPQIGNPVAYEIFVHDADTSGIASAFAMQAFRSQTLGYRGGIGGASGGASNATGGAPPASAVGGGTTNTGPNTGPNSAGPSQGAPAGPATGSGGVQQ